ncbi:MAG: hypothetical protein H6Q00_1877 [Holophagaceae bacterium]|nr:hypothetical protein [Holophagaceae bacterium]
MDFVHKWRERVPVLPERIEPEAMDLFSWDVTNADGLQRIYLTIYHKGSQDSFTIMRTTWRANEMTDLYFMRGVSSPYARGARGADGSSNSWDGYRVYRRP